MDAGANLQIRIDDANDGDVVCIAPGTYDLDRLIAISRQSITLQGTGASPDDVILRFGGAGSMGGISSTLPDVTVENFWVQDAPSNGVRISGANSVFRKLHVSWENENLEENGQYGIYPTESTNTLVEYCQMSGGRDAGIYVGKFDTGIVRNNLIHANVLGLEVENSINVQVYDNELVNNTGGLMALQQPLGETERISNHNIEWYDNDIWCNNHPNYAPEGGIISFVPAGTGVIVYAGDGIDIHDNNIELNDSVGAAVISNTLLCQLTAKDCPDGYPEGYNPYPQNIFVYDNVYEGNGTNVDTSSPFGELFAGIGWGTVENPQPNVTWDGYIEPDYTGINVCIGSVDPPSYLDFTTNSCTETPQGDVMAFGVCALLNQSTDSTAAQCDKPAP